MLTREEAEELLAKGAVGFVSSGRNPNSPKDKGLSDAEITSRSHQLRSDLTEAGLKFIHVMGSYEGETEVSFMVMIPDAKRDEITELGAKYNQDSVIYVQGGRNQMIYTSGEHEGKRYLGEGFQWLDTSTKDAFSEIVTPEGKKKFNLNFDFSKLSKALRGLFHRLGGLLHKSTPAPVVNTFERLAKSGDMMAYKVAMYWAGKAKVDWSKYDKEQFADGFSEEMEHKETVGGDFPTIVKIVLDHLDEDPKYYTKLHEAMEKAYKLQNKMERHGMDISIEQNRGALRQWKDEATGEEGMTRLSCPYGYFRRTMGVDGDQLDCFVGPIMEASYVYVITTMAKPDFKKVDEQKCMIGFANQKDAEMAFRDNYDDPRFLGGIERLTVENFKAKALATMKHPKLIRKTA